jgi:hypothetical protein
MSKPVICGHCNKPMRGGLILHCLVCSKLLCPQCEKEKKCPGKGAA